MLSRRAVLVSLARHGMLTVERQRAVRTWIEPAVRRALVEWDAPRQVFAAAGLPYLRPNSAPPPVDADIQRRIDEHLAYLGIDTAPILHVTSHFGQSRSNAPAWITALKTDLPPDPTPWEYDLPHKIELIARRAGEPVWQPLVELIECGVHPYGLDLDSTHFFIAVPGQDAPSP